MKRARFSLVGLLLITAGCAGSPSLDAPTDSAAAPRPVATMSDLMARVLYPYSDNIFYIATRTPATDAEWSQLEIETLLLAESANLLLAPERSRGELWDADTILLLDVSESALAGVRARDVPALEALNDPLYQSCVTCHEHFRPGYGG